MGARVIGLGQPVAGDDGVGIAVIRRLRETGVSPGVELFEAAEPTAIIPLLATPAPVILVDAVVVGSGPPGRVLELSPERLDPESPSPMPLSTHGVGVIQAIELARTLSPDAVSPRIRIVGVTIARPDRYHHALSPEVAAAVRRAAATVVALAGG